MPRRSGQRHQLGRSARGAHAAAGDDHRPRRLLQHLEGGEHACRVGLGPERRHLREQRLDQRLHVGLLQVDLALVAAELQVHGARRAGGRHAERLAHHVGDTRDVVDGGVELRDRLEGWNVVHLLVDLAELGLGVAPAGHGDDGRMRQIRVAQAGGEIERADHLGHADAGLGRSAGVAVGHVGGGFLAVGVDAFNGGAPLHLRERAPQNRRHHEHVADAVAFKHVGETLGAGHLGHDRDPKPLPVDIFEPGDLASTRTLACTFDALQEARIIQEPILEPVLLRLEADEDARRFAMARNDNVLLLGLTQQM